MSWWSPPKQPPTVQSSLKAEPMQWFIHIQLQMLHNSPSKRVRNGVTEAGTSPDLKEIGSGAMGDKLRQEGDNVSASDGAGTTAASTGTFWRFHQLSFLLKSTQSETQHAASLGDLLGRRLSVSGVTRGGELGNVPGKPTLPLFLATTHFCNKHPKILLRILS